jgi:hypothetical protein
VPLFICSRFAEITILVGSLTTIWVILCMTEAIASKAAMATKFKYIGGINDLFFGHFLFVANLGFAIGSTFGTYHMCSLQLEIMIFSGEGIEKETFIEIFWPVFSSITFLVIGTSGTVLVLKKNDEKKKDQRILNSICVNLDGKCDTIWKINNKKFNQPIINNIETFAIGLTSIGTLVIFMILDWVKSNTFIWFVLVEYFIINILLPCYGLRMQGHFNAFLWRTLYDLWNCLHTIFKGLTGHTGKIQKITKRTNINLVAESNAIAMPQMPSADQTLGQSLQELPHDEDTPATKIIFVVEVNATTMPTDYQTLGQFLQEMPPVEDVPAADNNPAASASANITPADNVGEETSACN